MADCGPVLMPGLGLYLQAFEDLSPSRPSGGLGGFGPIPFEAIDRYARRFGIDDADDFDDLLRFVRALDESYLGWAEEAAGQRRTSQRESP